MVFGELGFPKLAVLFEMVPMNKEKRMLGSILRPLMEIPSCSFNQDGPSVSISIPTTAGR